jgi:predicted transposase/invertase (TIGR01784 family)
MNAKEETEMAELAERNPAIGKVTAVIKQMSEDEIERALAEEREKARRIRHGQIMYGEKRGEERGIKIGEKRGIKIGKERGIEIGEERGIEEGKLEVARNLKRQQVNTEVIASATGLSAEEIGEL